MFYKGFELFTDGMQCLIQFMIARDQYEGHPLVELDRDGSGDPFYITQYGLGTETDNVNKQRKRFLSIEEFWGEEYNHEQDVFQVFII